MIRTEDAQSRVTHRGETETPSWQKMHVTLVPGARAWLSHTHLQFYLVAHNHVKEESGGSCRLEPASGQNIQQECGRVIPFVAIAHSGYDCVQQEEEKCSPCMPQQWVGPRPSQGPAFRCRQVAMPQRREEAACESSICAGWDAPVSGL